MSPGNMIVATDLVLSQQRTPILSGASVSLPAGRHVALIGPNGSGKSMLLRALAQEVVPDAGTVTRTVGCDLAFVPQMVRTSNTQSVASFLAAGTPVLTFLRQRLQELELEMSSAAEHALPGILDTYDKVLSRFESRYGWSSSDRLQRALAKLEVGHIEAERRMASISGGEQVRLALAAAYTEDPDFLLLDEPSAHLDRAGTEWLAKWIRASRAGVIFATHDRWLIDAVGAEIVSIDVENRTLSAFGGTYTEYRSFLVRERELRSREYQEYELQLATLRRSLVSSASTVGHARAIRDNDKAAYKSRGARVQKAVSQRVRAVLEQINRMVRQPVPRPIADLKFELQFAVDEDKHQAPVIAAAGLTLEVGNATTLMGLSFKLGQREHVCFTGRNGSGKSTLLSFIATALDANESSLQIQPRTRIGYLPQNADCQRPDESLFQFLQRHARSVDVDLDILFSRLDSLGLLDRADLTRSVGSMSGGERRQIQIGLLSVRPVDLLILDEPTNFLSFDVVDRLENALATFPGAVISASHDRWFVSRLPTSVINIEQFANASQTR